MRTHVICLFLDGDFAPNGHSFMTCAVKRDDLSVLSSTLCPVQITNEPHQKISPPLNVRLFFFLPVWMKWCLFGEMVDHGSIFIDSMLCPVFFFPLCLHHLSFLSGFVHDYSSCDHDPVLKAGRLVRFRLSRHCVLRLHHSSRALRPQGKRQDR